MGEAFFNKKYWHIIDINVWNLNETFTNDIVSFEQPGPDLVYQRKISAIFMRWLEIIS